MTLSTDYYHLKTLPLQNFDDIAINLFSTVMTDKRIFTNLALNPGGTHKADIFNKAIDIGGKINSGLGLVLNLTSITNPIGWGLMATNAIAKGKIAYSTDNKRSKLDQLGHIPSGYTGTTAAIAFAYIKLSRKTTRSTIAMLPAGGLYGSTAVIKHRNKANKGIARELLSLILWNNAIKGDLTAKQACDILTSGQASKVLEKHNFKEITKIENHNDVLWNNKEARKAIGFYRTIQYSMKST